MCVCLCVRSVSAELPVLSPSEGDGDVAGSGSEPPVRALLEQLAALWQADGCSSAPLHLLFAQLTVSAVLKASDAEVRLPAALTIDATVSVIRHLSGDEPPMPSASANILHLSSFFQSSSVSFTFCDAFLYRFSGRTTCFWLESW